MAVFSLRWRRDFGVGMDDRDAQRVDHFCNFRCHLDSGNNPEIHHSRTRNDQGRNPPTTLVWGGIGGFVGWFIGLPLGLILGMIAAIFIVEYLRNQDTQKAWKATVVALKAFGWTIAIELIAALSAATLWVVGLLLQSPAAA